MKITAQDAGSVADKDYEFEYEIPEAGFSEGPGDSKLAMMFQRDPRSDDYLSNSYCITFGSGETVYGELEQVSFWKTQGNFDFSGHAVSVPSRYRPTTC
jgi:hypothetical protein